MKVDGKCLCGFLAYEADVDPEAVCICNCTDCQTLSGSAFRVTVPASEFRFLSGAPATYVKTAASGNKRVLAFCPRCGTSVFSSPPDGESGYFGLRVGSLAQRALLVPSAQYWCSSAQPWTDHIADLPRHDGDE
jgi:hypothetical protein